MTSIIDAIWSLRTAMRRLWADHAIWTRQYIVAAVAGTPDAEHAAARLLRNQEDIGNAIVPYYGEEAGAALTNYLKEHILIAVDLVEAARPATPPASTSSIGSGRATPERSPRS